MNFSGAYVASAKANLQSVPNTEENSESTYGTILPCHDFIVNVFGLPVYLSLYLIYGQNFASSKQP